MDAKGNTHTQQLLPSGTEDVLPYHQTMQQLVSKKTPELSHHSQQDTTISHFYVFLFTDQHKGTTATILLLNSGCMKMKFKATGRNC